MKSSRLSVLGCLLADAEQACELDLSRDFSTVKHRTAFEGQSFLTITLPGFARNFESALQNGRCERSTFPGFSYPRKGALPKFLSGLLSLIFDVYTGNLVDEPSIAAIFFVRQICLVFKKTSDICSEQLNKAAFDKYVMTDRNIISSDSMISSDQLDQIAHTAGILFSDVFSYMDTCLSQGNLRPKHGPGKTAEGLIGNKKFYQQTWHDRLEAFFPSSDYLVPSWNFCSELGEITYLTATEEPSVRVVAVPKTHSTPRIIAIEPVCMQYTQQALLDELVPLLEEHRTSHEKRFGLLGYTDQTINQEMALQASRDGRLATLDLSDASDRVSNLLVRALLRACPLLNDAVQACRSLTACVPYHGTIQLNKFASMGSALCFVMESMVFATIAVIAAHKTDGRRVTTASIASLLSTREFRVYGDDIIVPTRYAQATIDLLEAFGLKVNRHKSFLNGKFRESCGCDAYDGMRVTPVYVRCDMPHSLKDSSELLSAIDTRNQFYKNGLWRTASLYDDMLRHLHAPMPIVASSSPVQGRLSFCFAPKGSRVSQDTQEPVVKGIKVRAPLPRNPIDGFRALLKFFLKRGNEPIFNEDHLERSGRPQCVRTQIGWGPVW